MNIKSEFKQVLAAALVLSFLLESTLPCASAGGLFFSTPYKSPAENDARQAELEARADRERARLEAREAKDAAQRANREISTLNRTKTRVANCRKTGHDATGEVAIELPEGPKRNFLQRLFQPNDPKTFASVKDFESKMVKRKDWGALPAPWERDPKAWKGRYMLGTPTDIVVHHTEGSQNQSMQSLQKTGMTRDTLDKKDISYHMLIKKVNGHWAFFEGRDPTRLGSHAAGTNSGRLGIAVVDNLLTHQPDPELVAAIGKAVAYYKAKYPSIRTLHTHGEGPHCAIPGHTNCGHNLSGPLYVIGKSLKMDNMI